MALNLDTIGKPIGPIERDYTWKDAALYALGVGAGFQELDYVYEKNLKVIPSFSIGAVFDFLMNVATDSGANLGGILHGEQDILFHSPIPVEGHLTTRGAITQMYDKGEKRGALVVAEADTYHHSGAKLFTNIFTLFCRKDGGFGGPDAPAEPVIFPERDPDFTDDAQPSGDQPLIYRLSGDVFALHVDPEFARSSGFERPIMHGLCTHGFACRAAVKHLMPGEPERMTRFRVRFSRTLYPGVPIRTLIWKTDEGRALFRVVNAETGEVVIDNGIVEWISAEELTRRRAWGAINFAGRVAVVTGAGAGLGRAYALELARRGARVVVNDLGGAPDGSGSSAAPADAVVKEIRAAGGDAVASHDSVASPAGGEGIIQTAMEAFGRVDVLIHNAGILRDRSLAKMSPEEWSSVVAVHLDGAYNVTRPALKVMRGQGYGRVVLTTSAAGMHGNFGQTNYAAAKLGIVGFMNTLKAEGARSGVKVNTVAPIAATRLTEDLLPPDLKERLLPEMVVPMTLYLSSEQCPVSGGIYNAGMGYFGRAGILTGPGATVGDGTAPPRAEEVLPKLQAIRSMKGAEELADAMAAITPILNAFSAPAGGDAAGAPPSVADIFERMADTFRADKAKGVDVVFQFEIKGEGGGTWHCVVQNEKCAVMEGGHAAPTTTITMKSDDFIALMEGRLNAMAAYTGGKLKIGGDIMKSQLIEKLFKL